VVCVDFSFDLKFEHSHGTAYHINDCRALAVIL